MYAYSGILRKLWRATWVLYYRIRSAEAQIKMRPERWRAVYPDTTSICIKSPTCSTGYNLIADAFFKSVKKRAIKTRSAETD